MRWIESLYAVGAGRVGLHEKTCCIYPSLEFKCPEDPARAKRLGLAIADFEQWSGPSHYFEGRHITLMLSIMPWNVHEARSWLSTEGHTLGCSRGPINRAQAQRLIDGLYSLGAVEVMVGNIHPAGKEDQSPEAMKVGWALRIALPTANPRVKYKLQVACFLLTQMLRTPSVEIHKDAERLTHEEALRLSTSLAISLHDHRNRDFVVVQMLYMFYEGWGDLLQSDFL